MKISLENAVKAISEYLTEEFSKMPKDFNDAWMNAGMHIMAEYTLATKGTKMLSALDSGSGYIDVDVLDGLIRKYADDLPDKSFKTILGDIKIKADTPVQLMEYFKKYGEN